MSDMTPTRVWTCAQFEAVLSEYREGTLAAAAAAEARAHVTGCTACSGLVAAVAAVQAQCAALPEMEPPPQLVANILAQTLRAQPARRPGARARVHYHARGWSRMWASVRTPRFALGLAMSVFAVALLLNAAQVDLGQVAQGGWQQLRPANMAGALTRRAERTWAHGVAYYHDLRVVYEIEAAIHQMRQSTPPAGNGTAGHNRSQGNSLSAPDELANAYPPAPAFWGQWSAGEDWRTE